MNVGGKTPLDLKLSVGGTSGSVTISGDTPTIESTLTSVSTTVNSRAIENLPVNGRNYLDFATLTPAVIRDQNREGDLSVGGQKGTLNNLQVDGADNNNTFFGQSFGRTGVRPPYQFSEESVQEFQVNQNGFSAEFGRAGGAGAVGRTDEPTSLPQECADGGGAVTLRGPISRPVAGALGLVGGFVSSQRPRWVDRLGRQSAAGPITFGGQQRAVLPTG